MEDNFMMMVISFGPFTCSNTDIRFEFLIVACNTVHFHTFIVPSSIVHYLKPYITKQLKGDDDFSF